MQVRSTLVRGGIAALAAAAAVMIGSPAALADDGAARGRVVTDKAGEAKATDGYALNLGLGDVHYIAKLFDMKLSKGGTLKLYCVQLTVGLRTDVDMVERPWNKYPAPGPFNTNSAKINWVLHHGYPATGLDALGNVLTKAGVETHDGISEREAIAATQAAVWHFSDGVNLDLDKPLSDQDDAGNNADVAALYKYLTGDQNKGIGEQPKPTLNIAADKTDGTAGGKIGPYSVATTGDITSLTSQLPDGVKITDKDGKELKAADVKDGSKLYVDVPAGTQPGKGGFTLKATGELDTGRLFVAENYARQEAQSLIVASSEKTEVTANAAASWSEAAAPTATTAPSTPAGSTGGGGELANTGVDAAVPFTVGGLLLGGGALMLLLNRRRSRA
ncbi:thioester domain-containing protein [Amycolatopsis australiensis]|uniref:LPXTG-motif cell wall anchor domain-containing protein/TQXA domain-containing protein n=1 Tax=Amycolatopsis australiensis TaxID=546364 RepID=A0A1K1QZ59_9PSEU|nr:thioester domain-containing protein [Amycolatopsis australiensis]SFW65053.1 LPXTG-motif cell wall anchor domain-containing protein/TQXA domain-containing protein [Amycolatopsis australiensis]